MQIVFKTTAPQRATLLQRLACWAIKERLVSRYCHGGIVIEGVLSHSNAAHGLHELSPTEWEPSKWVIVDVGTSRDTAAIDLYERYEGARYDWFSLLAFVGLRVRDKRRLYCFEWCWLALTGEAPTKRITPEMLLAKAVEMRDAAPPDNL